MKTFKTLITEVSLLTEGPAEKLFGKILFAQGRRHNEPKLKDEPDTEFEKKAWIQLKKFFFGSYDKKDTTKAFAAFDTLEKHKKDFAEILNPPPRVRKIYRGTQISLKDIRNKAWTKKGPDFKIEYEYSPRSNLQSWSTDRGTAEWFMRSRRPKKKGKVAGLLVLKTAGAQKLLFNPKWINKHFGRSAAGGEDEIVRVTKTPVTVTLVIDSDMFKKALDGEDPLKWFK